MIALLLAASLSLADYRARLNAIEMNLSGNRQDAAAAGARALLAVTAIHAGKDDLQPDRYTLEPIAQGHPRRARLHNLIAALETAQVMPGADRAAFEELQRERKARAMAEGGEVRPLPIQEPSSLQELIEAIAQGAGWLLDRIKALFHWLRRQFPDDVAAPGAPAQIARLVFVLVGAIVVLVAALAARALLAPRLPQPPPGSVRAAREDDDPLSRTASGWEERARSLAAEGRAREAIRAWYHALLVNCYGAGALHYRRGSTNWEYVHALSPALGWRRRFEDLTRTFDLEWYGHAESSAEALQGFAEGAVEILAALKKPA